MKILESPFLYKFKDQSSATPKGAPFEVETVTVENVVDGSVAQFGSLPPGFLAVFAVSTLRRQHYYAVADEEEAVYGSPSS